MKRRKKKTRGGKKGKEKVPGDKTVERGERRRGRLRKGYITTRLRSRIRATETQFSDTKTLTDTRTENHPAAIEKKKYYIVATSISINVARV